MKRPEPTPAERVLIARVIGDPELLADAEHAYYRTSEGRAVLAREGRHLELLFV